MSDNNGTQVIVDVTPVSLQCYADADECPAIVTLKNSMPSVKIETHEDGTTTATCPIRQYQAAQHMVNVVCFGCRRR